MPKYAKFFWMIWKSFILDQNVLNVRVYVTEYKLIDFWFPKTLLFKKFKMLDSVFIELCKNC